MSWTDVSDLEAAPADAEPPAEPRRNASPWAEFAWTTSACAHLGAQRTARSGQGHACAIGQAHPSGGVCRTAARCRPPQPKFGLGGPQLLTEDRQKPDGRLDGMHGARNTVPSRARRPCVGPKRELRV